MSRLQVLQWNAARSRRVGTGARFPVWAGLMRFRERPAGVYARLGHRAVGICWTPGARVDQ
jgi:hypothetical protein